MDDKTKELKSDLVRGLKNYFNDDIEKVKKFANQLKAFGFNLDDYETLEKMRIRSEALITLLGLFDFGVLESVVHSVEHLKGRGNPDDFVKHYVDIFAKPQQKNKEA